MQSKKMMKRWLGLLLVLVLLLASCATNGGVEPSDTQESKSEESTTAAPEIPEKVIPTKLRANILATGLVGRQITTRQQYHGWPSVCVDENGTLYAVASRRYLHICPFGETVMYTSTDGGSTWSPGTVINDTPMDERYAGIVYLGDGKLLLTCFNHATEFYLNYEVGWKKYVTQEEYDQLLASWAAMSDAEKRSVSYVRISEDYGKTWGEPISVPVFAPHGPTVLSTGTLLYVGSASGQTDYGAGIYAIRSKDGGKTWTHAYQIPVPDAYQKNGYRVCEPHVTQLESGRIVVVMRVQGPTTNDLETLITYSDDWGSTWSMAKVMDWQGAPAHLLQLENGVLVCTYSRRTYSDTHGPTGIYARYSSDEGVTWSDAITLSVSNDPYSDDLGYPATEQLADGTLVSVYYMRYQYDNKPSIMYTKWQLNEVE
ncbi:MAG: exo-alpha-sialidase [Clostridia bacterium]|nr:exo-alpha-sialidase [Clostridia bacterium]